MKKILRILLITVLVVLVALIVTPMLFKKQLLDKAKEVANTSVNAKVDFSDLKLSFFNDFPRLTTSLHDVSVVGIDVFESDTLVAFDEFSATVNVMSLIKKGAIKVRGILLDRPRISGLILEDGTANWDIAKESDEIEEAEADTTGGGDMDLNVALKKFEIRNASISYDDRSTGMKASLEDFNFLLSGDLGLDHTTLALSSATEKLNFVMDGMRYVKDASLDILVNVDADLVNSIFTLEDNSFAINDLVLLLDGSVAMPEDDDMSLNLNFATGETSFKSLLSMVPAVYMKDFEDVKTEGNMTLSGSIRGELTDTQTPSADLNLLVEDAMFSYPDLSKSADNIHIDVDVHYDGVQNDNSVVDVNAFHVELGENPVDFNMHMITPISDPQVNAKLEASIDFSSLADVIPLDDMKLSGFLEASIDIMGSMSSIENENFDEFKADGRLEIREFELESPDIPVPVLINRTEMNFSPEFVELADFDASIGSSDISLKGKLENFLPFVFEDGTIIGSLDLNSQLLDLNELMPTDTLEKEVVEEDSVVLSVIEVPANVDFTLQSSLKEVHYDNMDIENLYGLILVKDQKVILQDLNMDILKGKIAVSGEYITQDIKSPIVELSLDVQKIDIPSAFTTFVTVQKLAPVAENATGQVSTTLDFTSFLDEGMIPVMNSIVGEGNLKSEMIEINNSKLFEKIGDVLKSDRFKVISMRDLDLDYSIRNGRVYIQPYETSLGKSKLVMKGDQGIDQTMNYEMLMKIPRTELGSTAQEGMDQLSSLAAAQGIQLDPGETVDVKFLVTGTFKDPEIKPVFEEGVRNITNQVKEQVKEQVEEKVEEVKEEVKQEVKEEVDRQAEKILSEAQDKADLLKEEARNAGAELIRLAEEEGQKRIKDAGSNPLKKVAAEQYARTLKSEAQKKALKLEEEADQKADDIMQKAQEQADNL
jgi:hypothetical protein